MLTRGTKSFYVCLPCRRRLFAVQLAFATLVSSPTRFARRWQSTAASLLPLEEIDDSHGNGDQTFKEYKIVQPRPATEPGPEEDRYRSRKWRPGLAARLGVTSLGKPAEVLLLPLRDRKIPQAPEVGEHDRPGTTIQESIDLEKVPLSGAKLVENIEEARSQMGKMRGQLEKQEWKTLKKALRSGFQTAQLKKYIRLRKGVEVPSLGLAEHSHKDTIIRYIAEEVWGFTVPTQDELWTSAGKPGDLVDLSFDLAGDVAKLEHLLTHESQPLKRYAEHYDVQIKVDTACKKLAIIGPGRNARGALRKLKIYTENLGCVVAPLQGRLRALERGPLSKIYFAAYLKSLQQKYSGLSFAREEGKVVIVHLRHPRAAYQARREILLLGSSDSRPHKTTIWPDMDDAATGLQPYPTTAELPTMQQHLQWLRRVSTLASPNTVDSTSRSAHFARILHTLKETFGANVALDAETDRQNFYCEVTATFGQALTRNSPRSAVTGRGDVVQGEEDIDSKKPYTEGTLLDAGLLNTPSPAAVVKSRDQEQPLPKDRTFFVGGAPFLPQHLSRTDLWARQPKSQSHMDTDKDARAILRLELAPVAPLLTRSREKAPNFEIFVTAAAGAEGNSPPLEIARISAIYQEEQSIMLCPRSTVDVNFSRRYKQDLLIPDSADTDGPLWPLIGAFRGYIGHAQSTGSSDWVFPPFATLPVHQSMRDIQTQAKPLTQNPRRGRPPANPTYKKLEYLLSTVDVVDVASRFLTVHPPPMKLKHDLVANELTLNVDHITYTGADTSRQELRLAQSSFLSPPTLSPPHMPSFLKAAIHLAEQLSINPTKEISAMSSLVHDLKDIEDAPEIKSEPVNPPPQPPKTNPKKKQNKKTKAKKEGSATTSSLATDTAVPPTPTAKTSIKTEAPTAPNPTKTKTKTPKTRSPEPAKGDKKGNDKDSPSKTEEEPKFDDDDDGEAGWEV